MGRPRKEAAGTSCPRPATAAPKAAPAAPPPSASAARAKAAGGRARSAPGAAAPGPARQPEAKPSSSRPRAAAARGARGDCGEQGRAPAPGAAAAQKKQPEGRGAAAPAGSDPCSPRKPPSSHLSGALGGFLPPLESQDIEQVERETRGQQSNPAWYEWRKNRITASVAPRIAKSKFANGRTDEVPQSYLKAVVSSGSGVQTPAMSWGIRNEKAAVQAYEQLKSQKMGRPVKVEDCGLFIHKGKEWLAASPDGVIKEADTGNSLGLLEVKCPYKHRNKTVREACKDKDFCLELRGDSYSLKRDHGYYTQVQCQLAAAGFQSADFVVHTNRETAVAPVEFDPQFWEQTVPKLEKFYTEAVIPHLVGKAGSSVWAKEE